MPKLSQELNCEESGRQSLPIYAVWRLLIAFCIKSSTAYADAVFGDPRGLGDYDAGWLSFDAGQSHPAQNGILILE
jgi:hypothetical protein